ncbi:hypothetical protein BV20DRAFT_1056125 [Pilatotrama ljubarskyi]|nr:hypothetical protein BV20DRAFT_1056125 [Pilatotrama ljubarskyi]
MSSGGYESYTSVLEGLSQTKLCVVSATALMLYDWMISLDRERSFVWSGRLNVASVLYVLGRLVGPAANIVSMALFSPVNDHMRGRDGPRVCLGVTPLRDMGALRAHALSGRKILVTAIVFILNVAPAVFDAYVYFALSRAANYAPPIGCLDSGSQDIETYALM